MDNMHIAKQMIQFNKAAFNNGFNAMTMVYEQNEKVADMFLTQATWVPEEGKKAVQDWMSACRTGRTDLKKMVDDNYANVEAYFDKEAE